jgi:hypothetical protein
MMHWAQVKEHALLLRPNALPEWTDFVWTSWLAVVLMLIRQVQFNPMSKRSSSAQG